MESKIYAFLYLPTTGLSEPESIILITQMNVRYLISEVNFHWTEIVWKLTEP